MARQGRGASALATAAIGSFIAGTIATVALTFLAPAMVEIALQFGAAESFAMMVLAFTTVSALLGSYIFCGLASLFLGVTLALVGIDLQTGQARFAPVVTQLRGVINVVIVVVGPYALAAPFLDASAQRQRPE